MHARGEPISSMQLRSMAAQLASKWLQGAKDVTAPMDGNMETIPVGAWGLADGTVLAPFYIYSNGVGGG